MHTNCVFEKNDETPCELFASAHYNAIFSSPDVQNELMDICIKNIVECSSINRTDLAQCYDGASNMKGKYRGA
jgi:hypothetical protein